MTAMTQMRGNPFDRADANATVCPRPARADGFRRVPPTLPVAFSFFFCGFKEMGIFAASFFSWMCTEVS